jgi:hypothetical protein
MAFVAAAAVLLASFAAFLAYHNYPLLRAEVAMVAACLVAGAAVFALVYAVAGRMVAALLEGLLIFLALDINIDMLWAAIMAGAAAFLVAWLRQVSLLPMLIVLCSVILATTLVGLGQRHPSVTRTAAPAPAPAQSTEPAILHLILDEHIGLEGIGDEPVRQALAAFYTSRGFRLFGRAYGRHFRTANAVPDILNFGRAGDYEITKQHVRIGRTAYFDLLARRGYRLHVYQSEFADFCSAATTESCTRYWSPSLAFVEESRLGVSGKAILIGAKFADLSSTAYRATKAYNFLMGRLGAKREGEPPSLSHRALSSSLSALAAFDLVAADLRQARPGNLYFAHMLFPHYPYVVDEGCAMVAPSRWEYRRSRAGIEARRAAYHRQLHCAMKKTDELLAAFAESPGGRGGIVVVHGDHGSRITGVDPRHNKIGRFTDRDLIAGYSTLFAIRAPGIEARVDSSPIAVPALLGALAGSGFKSADSAFSNQRGAAVFLDGRNWKPGPPVPLPADWQPGGQ